VVFWGSSAELRLSAKNMWGGDGEKICLTWSAKEATILLLTSSCLSSKFFSQNSKQGLLIFLAGLGTVALLRKLG